MNESAEERIRRLEAVTEHVVRHPERESFGDLVRKCGPSLRGFRLVYATNNFASDFNGVSLSEIEERCPPIVRYFSRSGLLFYSDELFAEMRRAPSVKIPIDYSISFDTQVAETFRVYESGKTVSDWQWFSTLIRFVKESEFNFDYTFYLIEDLVNSYDLNNLRPFNTIRALKRFDSIDVPALLNAPRTPIFHETREQAGRRACDALATFQQSDDLKRSFLRRKGLLLILLKAVFLRWRSKDDLVGNLSELLEFSMAAVGRFAKLELYFGWKLLKYGEHLRFFAP